MFRITNLDDTTEVVDASYVAVNKDVTVFGKGNDTILVLNNKDYRRIQPVNSESVIWKETKDV